MCVVVLGSLSHNCVALARCVAEPAHELPPARLCAHKHHCVVQILCECLPLRRNWCVQSHGLDKIGQALLHADYEKARAVALLGNFFLDDAD